MNGLLFAPSDRGQQQRPTACRTLVQLVVSLLLASVLTTGPLWGQQLLLSDPIRAGELTLYPVFSIGGESHEYRYVLDKARLAEDELGRPRFSFLRYVDNTRPNEGEASREGEGGGMVLALIELGVSEDQLSDAERALSRFDPEGAIVGPAPWSSGTFDLVSVFEQEDGDLSRQVVGMGVAPMLDGQQAALAIRLTKQGAKTLWESFQTPAPQVTFRFSMELEGLRPPMRAKLEADWDRIYSHQAFSAALASSFLEGEINAAFDELRDTGAIRLVEVGSDADMSKLVTSAYGKLLELMFEPLHGTGTPTLSDLTAGKGKGLLDRASTLYASARDDAREQNREIRQENRQVQQRNAEQASASESRLRPVRDIVQLGVEERAAEEKALNESLGSVKKTIEAKRGEDLWVLEAAVAELQSAIVAKEDLIRALGREMRDSGSPDERRDLEALVAEEETAVRSLLDQLDKKNREKATIADELHRLESQRFALQQDRETLATLSGKKASQEKPGNEELKDSEDLGPEALLEEVQEPVLAVVAAYEMRRVRRSGAYVFDFEKYLPERQTMTFSHNIGDLSRYVGDQAHFREVNLDQPLFRQRQVSFALTGMNAADFEEYVDSVNVQLRRGSSTQEEVTIGRRELNESGNDFQVVYGWQGVESRAQFMQYEYRVVWDLFGGRRVELPWQRSREGLVTLTPPYLRKSIDLECDPREIEGRGVRLVTVRLYTQVEGEEQVVEASLRPDQEEYAKRVWILQASEGDQYEYEISWRLRGGASLQSGRMKTSEPVLFVDEIPEQEVVSLDRPSADRRSP